MYVVLIKFCASFMLCAVIGYKARAMVLEAVLLLYRGEHFGTH